jgi:hypothetical protein
MYIDTFLEQYYDGLPYEGESIKNKTYVAVDDGLLSSNFIVNRDKQKLPFYMAFSEIFYNDDRLRFDINDLTFKGIQTYNYIWNHMKFHITLGTNNGKVMISEFSPNIKDIDVRSHSLIHEYNHDRLIPNYYHMFDSNSSIPPINYNVIEDTPDEGTKHAFRNESRYIDITSLGNTSGNAIKVFSFMGASYTRCECRYRFRNILHPIYLDVAPSFKISACPDKFNLLITSTHIHVSQIFNIMLSDDVDRRIWNVVVYSAWDKLNINERTQPIWGAQRSWDNRLFLSI